MPSADSAQETRVVVRFINGPSSRYVREGQVSMVGLLRVLDFYHWDRHKGSIVVLLKLSAMAGILFVSPTWGLYLVDFIVLVLGRFGLSITYDQGGPIWGFGMTILPIMTFFLLFVSGEGFDETDFQLDLHGQFMKINGIESSAFTREVRQLNNPGYVFSSGGVVGEETRGVMLGGLLLFLLSSVTLLRLFLSGGYFMPSPADYLILAVSIVSPSFVLPITVSSIKHFRAYRNWRTFWLRYWDLSRVCTMPQDNLLNLIYSLRLSYDPSKHGSRADFIALRLDFFLKEFGIDPVGVPSELDKSDALDRLLAYKVGKDALEESGRLLKGIQVSRLVTGHIEAVQRVESPWVTKGTEAYYRSIAILILAPRLVLESAEAVEDLLTIVQRGVSSQEAYRVALDNYVALSKTPAVVWPRSSRWLLIGYSLATTVALLAGFALTNILLALRPPT